MEVSLFILTQKHTGIGIWVAYLDEVSCLSILVYVYAGSNPAHSRCNAPLSRII